MFSSARMRKVNVALRRCMSCEARVRSRSFDRWSERWFRKKKKLRHSALTENDHQLHVSFLSGRSTSRQGTWPLTQARSTAVGLSAILLGSHNRFIYREWRKAKSTRYCGLAKARPNNVMLTLGCTLASNPAPPGSLSYCKLFEWTIDLKTRHVTINTGQEHSCWFVCHFIGKPQQVYISRMTKSQVNTLLWAR